MGAVRTKSLEEVEDIIKALPFKSHRGITDATAEHFKVRLESDVTNGEPIAEYYPVYKAGKLSAYKVRKFPKDFSMFGDGKNTELFGQSAIMHKGSKVVITEGELDAMSAWQMLHDAYPTNEPNVVSLPNGANDKAIETNYEFLNSYREIIICTDRDGPGQDVAKKIAKAFGEKARIMEFEAKDANEMLTNDKASLFVKSFLSAKEFVPDGIVCGADVEFDDIFKSSARGIPLRNYPLFSAKLHGLRKGELTTVTAGSGIGKSTFAREIVYEMLSEHKQRMGLIFLEEPSQKTLLSYVAMDLHVPVAQIREDHNSVDRKEAKAAFNRLVHNDRFWYLDHFGSIKSKSLMDKMRYLAVVKKCDYIVLDHLSMVISGQASRDERKDIDLLMTELAAFTNETGVGIINIVHLKRTDGVSFNEGGKVSLNDLRGSAALEQLSWNVVALERDQQDEDNPNESHIRILKNREWGYTGLCDTCTYNPMTGRHYSEMMELS